MINKTNEQLSLMDLDCTSFACGKGLLKFLHTKISNVLMKNVKLHI